MNPGLMVRLSGHLQLHGTAWAYSKRLEGVDDARLLDELPPAVEHAHGVPAIPEVDADDGSTGSFRASMRQWSSWVAVRSEAAQCGPPPRHLIHLRLLRLACRAALA